MSNGNVKLVVLFDYNDGYDMVYAVADDAAAEKLIARNAEMYAGTHYESVADRAGRVLDENETRWFEANCETPETLDMDSLGEGDDFNDWIVEQEGEVVEDFEEAINED